MGDSFLLYADGILKEMGGGTRSYGAVGTTPFGRPLLTKKRGPIKGAGLDFFVVMAVL